MEKKFILSSLKMSLCICKEVWCVRFEQEYVYLGEGGENCLKYLKRARNRKERRGNKILKKGGGASWVRRWKP